MQRNNPFGDDRDHNLDSGVVSRILLQCETGITNGTSLSPYTVPEAGSDN